MNCKNHTDAEADFTCSSCGQPICVDCTMELNKSAYCKECLESHVSKKPLERKYVRNARKSKFLTFCFGMVPGAGHMYLGLINKGMSLMSVYFGFLFAILAITEILHVRWNEILIIPLSILCVFYSMFDSLATYNDMNNGKVVEDNSIVKTNIEFDHIKKQLETRKKGIGYALLILGGIGILNVLIDAFNNILAEYLDINLRFSLKDLFLPGLLVTAGVYLLKKSREGISVDEISETEEAPVEEEQ